MKKIKKILVILLIITLFTGCGMKENFNLKIDSDKKVGFEVKILMDNDMIDSMLSMTDNDKKTYSDEDRWNYLEDGDICKESDDYTCEKISEDNFKGFNLKTNQKDIDSLTGTGEKINIAELDSVKGNSLFTKDGDVYSSNFEFNFDDEKNEIDQYSNEMDILDISFTVTLPNKSISNNADKVSSDGKTLTWDLSSTENKSIDFSFKFDPNAKADTNTNDNTNKNDTVESDTIGAKTKDGMSTTTLLLIVAGSVFGLLVIILLIVLITKKSKKKDEAPATEQVEPENKEETKTEE